MDNPPERLWDFWPHNGGAPVIWREPCPFPADDADVFEYVLADHLKAVEARLAEAVEGLENIQAEVGSSTRAWKIATATLAKIKGETNDE